MSMGFGTKPEAPMSANERKHLKALKEAGFTDKQINKMKTRKGGGLKNEQVNIKGVKPGRRGGDVITIGGGKLTDTEKEQRKNLRNLRNKTVTAKKEAEAKRIAAAAKRKKAEDAKKKRNQQNNNNRRSSSKTSIPNPVAKIASRAVKEGWIDDLISGAGKYSGLLKKWWNQQQKGTSVVPVKPKPKKPGKDLVPVQPKSKRPVTTTTPKTGTKTGTNTRQGSVPKSSRTRVNRELKTGTSPNIRPRDLAIKTGLATLGGTLGGQEAIKPKKSPLSKVKPPRKPQRGKAPFKMEDPTFSKPKPRVDTFKDMPKKKKKTLAAAKKAGDNMKVPAAKKKKKNERYRYYGKPGETIGDLSRKFEIKYDTKPQAMLPHEEGFQESNKRGGQIKGYKKGGKVSRPRGVGVAQRGWGKAMK